MADLSTRKIGIGLASWLLAGAVSLAAATGVGEAAARRGNSAAWYVYTESNQTSADGGNAVLAFRASAGGALTSIGSFATGGDGTGVGLGSQGAVALASGGHALLVVNAGSNTVSYFRVLSDGSLRLVDAAPSSGADPVSVTADHRRVEVLNQGSSSVGGLILTGDALVPSPNPAVSLASEAATPVQIGFTPSGSQVIVTEKVSSSIDTFKVTSDGRLSGRRHTISTGTAPYGFGFSEGGDAIVSDAGGGAGGVSAATSYRVGSTGALHPISEVGESQAAACWLVINGAGNRAYVANAASGTVSSYDIAESGRLTLRSAVAATVGAHPIDEILGGGWFFVLTSTAVASAPVTASGDLGAVDEAAASGLPAAASGLALVSASA
ncbi:MAG TPA: beta-propeller fold lactonase family protein [Candidatus Saccharimonadales bacterium]|nr:beta-propeller fold lactonase family protein [Candidatus Saccharimonadales bacterium]